jgi:pyruvate formate lyase activating enzyme
MCVNYCFSSALDFQCDKLQRDNEKYVFCGDCTDLCLTGAIGLFGKKMNAKQVLEECLKDLMFYRKSGGGVTLSGGEAFFQFEFALEILRLLKENGIHTAVETTGYLTQEKLYRVLPFVDLFLFDLKGIDDEKHKMHTGVSNKRILKNLKYLSKTNKEVIVRIPIIPKHNDSKEDINQLISFLKSLNSKYLVNLLPYHKLGSFKYKALGRNYELETLELPSIENLEQIRLKFEKNGIDAKIVS